MADMAAEHVIDSSAIIALLKPESTTIDLSTMLAGNPISTANYSEAADFFARAGRDRSFIVKMLNKLDMELVPVDADLALDAAMLRPMDLSLSLGDRCCLSLAKRLDLPALTGDRRWQALAPKIGVELMMIR